MAKEFRYFEEALDFSEEAYATVYFDPKNSTLERGVYLVPQSIPEIHDAIRRGLEIATGFEGERQQPDWEGGGEVDA